MLVGLRLRSRHGMARRGDRSGPDCWVYSFGTYRGDLVAGGCFSNIGNVAANRVARWNGSAWNQLGQGLNFFVRAFTEYGDNLVAGGEYVQAPGPLTAGISLWDGS